MPTANKAECGGIEPPRPSYGRKPVLKTGRATRPTHSKGSWILIHRLTVAASKDAGVAQPSRHARVVGVLEPGLSVLAARAQPIAEAG